MILASIETTWGGPRSVVITLTDKGWRSPEARTLARILDLDSPLSKFGPADGDPVACAANRAAEFLGGRVTFVRSIPEYPPGTDH